MEGTLPSLPHSVFRWSLFSKAPECFLGYETGKGKAQVWETEGCISIRLDLPHRVSCSLPREMPKSGSEKSQWSWKPRAKKPQGHLLGCRSVGTGNQYQGWVLRTAGELNKRSQVESKWATIKGSCLEEAIVCGLTSLAGRGIELDWVGRVKGQLIPQGCVLQEELYVGWEELFSPCGCCLKSIKMGHRLSTPIGEPAWEDAEARILLLRFLLSSWVTLFEFYPLFRTHLSRISSRASL